MWFYAFTIKFDSSEIEEKSEIDTEILEFCETESDSSVDFVYKWTSFSGICFFLIFWTDLAPIVPGARNGLPIYGFILSINS